MCRFVSASYMEISMDFPVAWYNLEDYKKVCSSLVHRNFHGFISGMVEIEDYK